MTDKTVNVLVTGASGLLGRMVYKYFTDQAFQNKYPLPSEENSPKLNWNCLGLCYSRLKEGLKSVDLNDYEEVNKLTEEFKPNVIIHCAAEKRIEIVENNFDKALKLNKDATKNLAEICAKRGILFVYISTDYVFDGTNPPYFIDSETNPLNKYGKSKLQGEKVTLESSTKHCIVRVPVLYGFTEKNNLGESAVNILLEKLQKGEPYSIDHVQIRRPTNCIDVARFCMQLVKRYYTKEDSDISGIFHCSTSIPYTKYEMSLAMADALGLNKDIIKPDQTVSSQSNLRPLNAKLDTTYSFDKIGFKIILEFKDAIKEALENFV